MKWISYIYTYIPSPLNLAPAPPSHPSRSTEPRAGLPVLCSSSPLALFYAWWCIHVNATFPVGSTLSYCTPHAHKSILYICISIPCPENRFIFQILLMCVNIWYLFFWLTSLCMTRSRFIHITTNDPISFLSSHHQRMALIRE